MSVTALRQSLDGENFRLLELDRKGETGEHRLSVDEHGAGAALSELAAVLGSGEPQIFSQDFEKRLVRGDGDLFEFPVDAKPQQHVFAHVRYSTTRAETSATCATMKEMSRVLLLTAALACQSPAPPEKADLRELEIRMAELVNVEREARGLAPFTFSPALADVGRAYSARMAEARTIHHDLDHPMEERIAAVLPDICTFGENVSKHTTIDYSLGDLMVSKGHRGNVLSERFTLIGIGIVEADGFLYITQEFARPCDPPPKGSKRRKNLPE